MLNKTNLPTVDECCGTCRYWFASMADKYEGEDDSELTSDCRRYPPRHNRHDEEVHESPAYGNPRTKIHDWCGEWRAKQHNAPPAPPGQ